MSVQSKQEKCRQKYEALKSKLKYWKQSSVQKEYIAFLLVILGRCVKEEKEAIMQMEGMRNKIRDQRQGMSVEDVKIDKNLFAELPDEVVETIFEKLSNPDDLNNCHKTCRRFQRILEPTKPIWLFNRILPHIVDEKYVTVTDILNCRLVCTEWRRSVDDLVQNIELTLTDFSRSYKSVLRQVRMTNLFGQGFKLASTFETLHLEKLPKALQCHKGNPFVTRKLFHHLISAVEEEFYEQIEDNVRPDAVVRFWRKAIKFLKQFGEHLWEYKFVLKYLPIQHHFHVIRRCFENIKSVKKISLYGLCHLVESTPEDDAEVERALTENPLPALPLLECLELDGVHTLFYKHIFPTYFQQLRRLNIHVRKTNSLPLLPTSPGETLRLENLMELSVRQEHEDASMLLFLDCPNLIDLWLTMKPSKIHPATLLKILKRFGAKLQRVRVDYSIDSEFSMTGSAKAEYNKALLELHLPCVKILTLVGWMESLNILLCMPVVNYVHVIWVMMSGRLHRKEDDKDVIGIWGFEKQLYKSVIWTVMPYLMEIELSSVSCTFDQDGNISVEEAPDYNYTREGLEYYQKMKNL